VITKTLLPCGDTVVGPTTSRPAECHKPEHRTWIYIDQPDHIQRREQTVVTTDENKTYAETDFQAYVEDRKGWKFIREEERIVGMRTLEYGRYSATIWAEMGKRLKEWNAHISLPFSAGPESSTRGPVSDVKTWIDQREALLQVPLRIAECRAYSGAMHLVAEALKSDYDLYLMTCVFDLDFHELSLQQLRYKLVERCAPKLIPRPS
jgi:hypothetical protein